MEKLRSLASFFDRAEVERLVAAGPAWLGEMVRFAFTTGWRRGELLGLRWEWIAEGEARLPDSKNGEPRVVPVAGELREIMARLKAARKVTQPDGSVALSEFVFHDSGRPITRKRFTNAWTAPRKAAKLDARIFHDFRRSAARRMTQAGVPQGVAMKITGHETPSTFERYAIAETTDSARALDRVAAHEEPTSGGTLTVIGKRRRRG